MCAVCCSPGTLRHGVRPGTQQRTHAARVARQQRHRQRLQQHGRLRVLVVLRPGRGVGVAVRVRAGVQQQLHFRRAVGRHRGDAEGAQSDGGAQVGVRAGLQQRPRHLGVPVLQRDAQGGVAHVVLHVQQVLPAGGAQLAQQDLQHGHVAAGGRQVRGGPGGGRR
jgi:hypothetical protein